MPSCRPAAPVVPALFFFPQQRITLRNMVSTAPTNITVANGAEGMHIMDVQVENCLSLFTFSCLFVRPGVTVPVGWA